MSDNPTRDSLIRPLSTQALVMQNSPHRMLQGTPRRRELKDILKVRTLAARKILTSGSKDLTRPHLGQAYYLKT